MVLGEVTTVVGDFVVEAAGEIQLITVAGQKTNTEMRRKQETPTTDREKMDNPLHVY